jgi:hypothetical protein
MGLKQIEQGLKKKKIVQLLVTVISSTVRLLSNLKPGLNR